jgi:hypothetical protein
VPQIGSFHKWCEILDFCTSRNVALRIAPQDLKRLRAKFGSVM